MLVVPSLKAYYRMEGNALDASGNGNHGTVVGATLVGVGTHYDNGIEYVEWTTGYTAGTGSQSKESDHLYLYCPATNGTDRTYVTDNKIDLTNIAKIKVEWSSTNGDDGPFGMVLSVDNDKGQRARLDEVALAIRRLGKFTKQINEIDVSSISGDRHIKTAIEGASFDGKGVSEMEVYKIWLEDSNENIIQIDLGKFGKCYSFDGTDDYINFATISNIGAGKDFFIGIWLKTNTTAVNKTLLEHSLNGSNRICMGTGDSSTGADKIGAGVWNGSTWARNVTSFTDTANFYFLSCNYTSDHSITVYLNAVEITDAGGPNSSGTAGFRIGSACDGSYFWNGLADEPIIFDRTLSLSEIKRVMLLFPPTTGG